MSELLQNKNGEGDSLTVSRGHVSFLLSAIRNVQCSCTLKERASGHLSGCWMGELKEAGEYFQAELDKPIPATSEPAEFVSVPREPTPEMKLAGFDAIKEIPRAMWRRYRMDAVWKAMLAAAPHPDAAGTKKEG